MDNNSSENSTKINNSPNISFSNITGHVTYTNVKGDKNEITNYISGDIKVDNNTLEKIDPIFQESLKDFTNELDALLKDKEISKEKLVAIKTNLTSLATESQDVNPSEELKDGKKKEAIIKNLKDLTYNIVDLSPQVAETVASMTPLAPFAKPIGKAISYMKDLIQHKLSGP